MIASISGPIVIRAHVRKRPAGENRQAATYFIFLYLLGFLAFLTVWIGSIIYVISASKYYKNNERDRYKFDVDEMDLREQNSSHVWLFSMISLTDVTIVTVANYYRQPISCGLILWYILAGQFILFSFFILLRYTPKFFTHLGLLCLIFSVIGIGYNIVRMLINSTSVDFIDVTSTVLRMIFASAAMMGALKVGVSPIAEIIQKAFRAMFTFYSIIIFIMLVTLMIVLQLILMIQSLQVTTFNDPLRYTILFGSFYVFSFICSYQNMVIAHLIASWHRPAKQTPPVASILVSASKVSRHHLGAVAYSATYFLPLLQVIFVYLKQKFSVAPKYQNLHVEIASKVYIILNFTKYAETMVAMHGDAYGEAIKKSFYILVKNSSMFLAVVEVFNYIGFIGLLITYLIIFLLPILALDGDYNVNPMRSGTGFAVILLLVLVFLLPAILASTSCVATTLICALEDEEEQQQQQQQTAITPPADEENPPPYEAAVE